MCSVPGTFWSYFELFTFFFKEELKPWRKLLHNINIFRTLVVEDAGLPASLPPVYTCPPASCSYLPTYPRSHLPTFLLFTPAHSLPVYTCPPAFCSHLPFCLLFIPTCPPSSCSYLSTYLLFTPALLSSIHTCPHASCSNFLSPFVNFHLSSLVVFRKFWCSDCLLLLLHSISTITRAWTQPYSKTNAHRDRTHASTKILWSFCEN